jgi:hypothetical protein
MSDETTIPASVIPASWLAGFETVPFGGGEDGLFRGRFDTKYLFPAGRLPEILAGLARDYRLVEFGRQVVQEYRSLYFDDDRLTLYQDHQRGRLGRFKVRFRSYDSTGFACLELKMKTNRRQTHKWRRPITSDQFESGRLPDFLVGLAKVAPERIPAGLEPRLRVRFLRLTFCRREAEERLTFDTGLVFTDVATGRARVGGEFVVAEVKQVRPQAPSPFRSLMRRLRITPAWFSKYCYGTFLFRPEARHNRLMPKYRALTRRLAGPAPDQPAPAAF